MKLLTTLLLIAALTSCTKQRLTQGCWTCSSGAINGRIVGDTTFCDVEPAQLQDSDGNDLSTYNCKRN